MLSSRRQFAVGTAGTFAGLALARGPIKAAQYEFKCASNLANDHPTSVRLLDMFQAVERESAGRVKVNFFPNSVLGGDSAMLSQLRTGAIQMFMISAGNLSTVVPSANMCYLGFAFKDADEGLRVMNGPAGAYVRDDATAKGIHAMRQIWDSGMYHVGSGSRAIHSPDDLKNFKLRVTESRIFVDMFKEFGSSPVALSLSELYSSLQTKLVDGEALTLVTIESQKFYEVNKYISLTNHAWAGLWLLVNGDVWKSMPADLQNILERNNTRFAQLEQRDTRAGLAAVTAKLGQQGIAFNTIDPAPFRARLSKYYEFWASEFGSTAWGLLQTSLGHKIG